MSELNTEVRGLLVPAPRRDVLTRSVEVTLLHRDERHVVRRSERLTDAPVDDEAVSVLRGLAQSVAGLPLQSAVSSVQRRTGPLGTSRWSSVLARIESLAGPVLIGAGTAGEPDALLGSAAVLAARDVPLSIGRAPGTWADRMIVLRPPVAAIIVTGAAMALNSAGGRRMRERRAGRLILPRLTVTDVPLIPGESTVDDLGEKAEAVDLIRDGRAVAPERPRSRWDHDSGTTVAAPGLLRLTGPALPVPEQALELHWCLEGLQRYHSDGTVALHCLARAGDWFGLTLRAKPLRLLRSVLGCAGPEWTVSTDGDVSTPALVLPPARELLAKDPDALTLTQP
ncbi:hypothetical protein GCM10011609_06620 [Lentzea pudingi]|uniref:Uncharacterized protein n=1 Tax=Lentzea pudingi TaxID=1789439 RepID=A0ABQ2HAR9_9PSEU|nr:hypothetical protein [Lentzea pudingi]GGM73507.1 hypothetical protein GCM10011609_06620 [Lentzea pudingi]